MVVNRIDTASVPCRRACNCAAKADPLCRTGLLFLFRLARDFAYQRLMDLAYLGDLRVLVWTGYPLHIETAETLCLRPCKQDGGMHVVLRATLFPLLFY